MALQTCPDCPFYLLYFRIVFIAPKVVIRTFLLRGAAAAMASIAHGLEGVVEGRPSTTTLQMAHVCGQRRNS